MKKSITFSIFGILAVVSVCAYFLLLSPKSTITEGHAILPQYNKEDLIQQSDVIVIAQVIKMESLVAPSKINEKGIVTNVTLKVEEYLRNQSNISSEYITVQNIGGKIGEDSVYISGAASFTEGERVLIFLDTQEGGTFSVYGWMQGKYTLNESKIAVDEDEIARFKDIFGVELTIDELRNEINLHKNIRPYQESTDSDASSKKVGDGNVDSANLEAASVIE